MTWQEREKWDRQHAAGAGSDEPSEFLKQIFETGSWVIPAGRALDIATGKGRNAIFLAGRGFSVDAVDISPVALDEASRRAEPRKLIISWRQADLEHAELPDAAYGLIVNFNFLQRSLIPQIGRALKPGGHVIFETYLIDQRALGHPKNPAHLLGHNELLGFFPGWRVLWYREGQFPERGEAAFRAGLLAQKPAQ